MQVELNQVGQQEDEETSAIEEAYGETTNQAQYPVDVQPAEHEYSKLQKSEEKPLYAEARKIKRDKQESYNRLHNRNATDSVEYESPAHMNLSHAPAPEVEYDEPGSEYDVLPPAVPAKFDDENEYEIMAERN